MSAISNYTLEVLKIRICFNKCTFLLWKIADTKRTLFRFYLLKTVLQNRCGHFATLCGHYLLNKSPQQSMRTLCGHYVDTMWTLFLEKMSHINDADTMRTLCGHYVDTISG